MKKSIISFFILFGLTVFCANTFLAASDPIPGLDVVVKKNLGGIAVTTVKTDKEGKFSIKLGASLTKEGSRYDLQISHDAIMKMLSRTDPAFVKNKDNYVITLQITSSGTGLMVNDKPAPAKITIDNSTGALSLLDRMGNTVVSGTLTYELRGAKPAGKKEKL